MLFTGLLALTGTYALLYPLTTHRNGILFLHGTPSTRLVWDGLERVMQPETIQGNVEFSDYDIEDVETWLITINNEWNDANKCENIILKETKRQRNKIIIF